MSARLELSPGAEVVLDGVGWRVERLEPHVGRVALVAADGARLRVTMGFLMNHPACRMSSVTTAARAAERGRQPVDRGDLSPKQWELVRIREAHLLEVETGYRGGDPLRPAPGEPKPAYDPASTTLTQRRQAKAAELAALSYDEARVLGLARVGVRTLERWEARLRRFGVIGCADDRWLRPTGAHPSVTEIVREAIYVVHAESLHRSRMSLRTKERLIHQYVREQHGAGAIEQVPSYQTLRTVWLEWFGPGGGRQRYVRSAARATSGEHVVVHRPGQVVALDTTVLPVKVRETVFGDPVSVHLTLALDLYTHSLPAFRLTLVSDSAIDVAMVLRDVTMPIPMREDWGSELEWPYPGIPASVVGEFAGHPVAGLPFFAPETVTTDHGSVYRNHHLVDVQRVLGTNILPARVLRPTDKQAVERAFGGIRSLLFEQLPGYTGVDVADRGADPEADAVLTIDEMEHVIATWIVAIWQNRRLGEFAPSWDPGGDHSPNTLFAAAMAQGGFAMQIPASEQYYELLPAHHVGIHHERGVKIRGLWYDGPALDPYRHQPTSGRGGQHKGKWLIRRDPRDARAVFFQDPRTHEWHELRWKGLPAREEVPAFGDARVHELLAQARDHGLAPRSDTELLPVLLDILGGQIPVEKWPAQAKAARTSHARDTTRAAAARTDRPPRTPAPQGTPVGDTASGNRGGQLREAVDTDRRRRRLAATSGESVSLPSRLGDSYRRGNLFLLTNDDAVPAGDTAEPLEGSL